jgi:hypothetical protein
VTVAILRCGFSACISGTSAWSFAWRLSGEGCVLMNSGGRSSDRPPIFSPQGDRRLGVVAGAAGQLDADAVRFGFGDTRLFGSSSAILAATRRAGHGRMPWLSEATPAAMTPAIDGDGTGHPFRRVIGQRVGDLVTHDLCKLVIGQLELIANRPV